MRIVFLLRFAFCRLLLFVVTLFTLSRLFSSPINLLSCGRLLRVPVFHCLSARLSTISIRSSSDCFMCSFPVAPWNHGSLVVPQSFLFWSESVIPTVEFLCFRLDVTSGLRAVFSGTSPLSSLFFVGCFISHLVCLFWPRRAPLVCLFYFECSAKLPYWGYSSPFLLCSKVFSHSSLWLFFSSFLLLTLPEPPTP